MGQFSSKYPGKPSHDQLSILNGRNAVVSYNVPVPPRFYSDGRRHRLCSVNSQPSDGNSHRQEGQGDSEGDSGYPSEQFEFQSQDLSAVHFVPYPRNQSSIQAPRPLRTVIKSAHCVPSSPTGGQTADEIWQLFIRELGFDGGGTQVPLSAWVYDEKFH